MSPKQTPPNQDARSIFCRMKSPVFAHVYINIYMCSHIYIYIYLCICMYVCMYMYTHIYVYMFTYMHKHSWSLSGAQMRQNFGLDTCRHTFRGRRSTPSSPSFNGRPILEYSATANLASLFSLAWCVQAICFWKHNIMKYDTPTRGQTQAKYRCQGPATGTPADLFGGFCRNHYFQTVRCRPVNSRGKALSGRYRDQLSTALSIQRRLSSTRGSSISGVHVQVRYSRKVPCKELRTKTAY